MAFLELPRLIPVEDIQKSVEESHYEFMDTSENGHQVSEQYGPFDGFQAAMEEDMYAPHSTSIAASCIQYIQGNGRQYSFSNSQLVPLIEKVPVTETSLELALTSEIDNKSDTERLKELTDIVTTNLRPAIPRGEELSIRPHGSGSMSQSPQAEDTEEEYDGDWDSTYQPIDELEPRSQMSTKMPIPGIKRANSITLDHSYGTKESSLKNLEMKKDGDLHKGLNFVTSCNEVQKSKTKKTPIIQDTQKMMRNSMTNRKNLLRELRQVQVAADINQLKMDKLRQLVPRLVRFLYYQQDDPYRRGIYEVPEDWPKTKFFGDPCNRLADGGRPRKDMIVEMSCEMFTRYQQVLASSTEDVKGAVEAC